MSHALRMTCFKLPVEVRAQIDVYCRTHGVTISDFYRAITEATLSGQIAPGPVEGYKQARALAAQLAAAALAEAAETLPATLEEAMMRYGLVSG